MKIVDAKYVGHLELIDIFEKEMNGKVSGEDLKTFSIDGALHRDKNHCYVPEYDPEDYRLCGICRLCNTGSMKGKALESVLRNINERGVVRYVYRRLYWSELEHQIQFIITAHYVQDEDKFGEPMYMSYHKGQTDITLFTGVGTIEASLDEFNALCLNVDLYDDLYNASIIKSNIEVDLDDYEVKFNGENE